MPIQYARIQQLVYLLEKYRERNHSSRVQKLDNGL